MGEWKETPLGELTDNFDSIRVPVKQADRRSGPYPYYGASGIVDRIDDYLFDGGYLLIAEDGENLRTRNTPVAFLAHGKFWVNNHAHIVRGNYGANTRYLMYALSTLDISGYLTGSTMPKLTQGNMNRIRVQAPPFPEQKAIAFVLSSLDNKIDLLRRQNKTLEAMAETLFRQWFDNYETKKHTFFQLKNLVKQVKPGTNYQPKRIESGIPFLNVRNLSNGFINKLDIKYISDEEHSRIHKTWKPEENDILISRIGTLGVVAQIRRQDLPIAVHYNMLNIKAKKTSHHFLYYLLKSKYFQIEYDKVKRESVQAYVAVEDAESIEIPLPSSQEQIQYLEEQLTSLFVKTLNNYNQTRTLEKLRDTLLPKLMSGKVRVE